MLSPTREALLRALAAGASVEEAARAAHWTRERAQREVRAALDQAEPADTVAKPVGADAGPIAAEAQPVDVDTHSATGPERPALAPDVVVEPAPPAGEHRVVHDPRSGRYLRVRLRQAAFLESLDGSRSLDELRASATVDSRLVEPLVAKFAQLGLLEGTAPDEDGRSRPADRRGGFALRLGLVDPEAMLARARPLICAAATPAAAGAAGLIAAAGTVAFFVNLDGDLLTSDRLRDPLLLVTLLAAMLLTAMLHELGHAGAVALFGGRVRRMGFMLFYLLPALFCDTTDAWRFPFAWQRVVVALAGMATQLVVVGLVAQVLWLPLGTGVQAWILLYVLLNLGMCAYNLIPLVKLDGYWALSAMLDRPNLRAQAIERARAWVRRVVLGDAVQRERGDALTVAFGSACALFAPALVTYALLRWEDLLLRLDWLGAMLWLTLVALIAARPAKAAWLGLRPYLARSRRPRPRAAASLALATIALVAAAGLVRVPTSAGGTLVRHDGRGYTAAMSTGAVSLVRPRDAAELGARSLVADRDRPRGTVVRRDDDRWVIVLARGERRPAGDELTVDTGSRPLSSWLWHAHVRPALDAMR